MLNEKQGDSLMAALDTGGFDFSFFLVNDSGLPIFFSSVFANFAFARRCCGVCACLDF
jgi:hypothetical protein